MKYSDTDNGANPSAQDQSSGMVKVRRQRVDPFSRVPHAVLEDERLSWRAKGIMAYLLGRPDDWIIRMRDIQNRSKEGRDAIRSAMQELKRAGYAKMIPRIDCGRMMGAMWEVTDISVFDEASPTDGFSGGRETSRPETRPLSKKEGTKKEGTKNKTEETKETDFASQKSVDEIFEPEWKPNPGTKEEKLKRIRPPKNYPSETEFDRFLDSEQLDAVVEYRPDLYSELCRSKWQQWKDDLGKWVRIRDWKAYVLALDHKII